MKGSIFFIILFVLSGIVYGQHEPAPPVPALPDMPGDTYFEQDAKDNEQLYLKKLSNEMRAQLQSIKELDEHKYYELLRQAYFNNMGHYFVNKEEKSTVERDRKINESELKTEILAAKYELDKKADKQKIETELRAILDKLFDLKEEQRKDEIQRIEKELAKLKESIVVRQKNKKEIINERIRDLLGKGSYLNWD